MDSLFAAAKSRFAFLLENEWNVHAGFSLDIRVAVMKRVVQQARQMPADRRLARAHGPYQKNVALVEHDRR